MIIQFQNGTRHDISDYNLKRLFHRIPLLNIEHTSELVEGRDGNVIVDSRFGERTISVELLYQANDIHDFYLLRDELHALFAQKESFYLIFKKEPYKRWLVRLANGFTIEPNPRMNSFVIDFICENIYAESVGTSLDLQNKKEWDANLWGWGMGLNWDKEYRYEFNTSVFTVENVGNVTIDPRQQELEITLKGPFPNGVTITNNTTGGVYKYNGPLTNNDTLKLSGIRSLKNGISVFGNTNRKLLTLIPGNNNFTVTGGTPSSIAFNFRFLYK